MPLLSLRHTLEGTRVRLRAPRLADAARLIEIRKSSWAFLRRWMPAPTEGDLDLSVVRARIREERRAWSRDRKYRLLVIRLPEGRVIGMVALSEIVRGPFQNAYLGYWIEQREAEKGLMTEAVRLALALAFGPLGLHRVQAAVSPRNAPSLALARKVGLREEGLARRYLQLAGRWEDHLLLAITREEWPPGSGR